LPPIFEYKGFNAKLGTELESSDFISVDSKSGTIYVSCLNTRHTGSIYIKVVGFLPNGID
jgi:hypothetical protein